MAKKIVVVDDAPDIVKIVEFILKKAGYEVFTASDGEQGLKLIQDQKPDLAFVDIHLPIMEGVEVCKRLKSDPAFKEIPIVFLTGTTENQFLDQKAKESGVNDVLMKPFTNSELRSKVSKFLDK